MGKIIRRVATDLSQGHCWPPMSPIPGAGSVLIEGYPAMKVGDSYNAHPGPCGTVGPHAGVAVGGSPDVFVEGVPVHRDADEISCGDVADIGAMTVFANGAGRTGAAGGPGVGPNETVGYTVGIPEFTYPGMKGDEIIIKLPISSFKGFVNPTAVGSNCSFSLRLSEAYSPLEEEDTGTIIKNFPGPALTVQSGQNTVTSPGRPELNTAIPISTKFKSLKWVASSVKKSEFALTVNFNKNTGHFSGNLKVNIYALGYSGTTLYQGEVEFTNFVGTTTKTVIFEGQEVPSTPTGQPICP